MQPVSSPAFSERTLILVVALVQFINILDFMMVMPLGPDFARALQIPVQNIGIVGGAYTFAAAISGLVSALFLDKFARKPMILMCLAGLTVATFAGALVWNESSMIAARLLAGMFGGPLTSLSIAIVADMIPPERRGRAMGKVSGAFAAASVLGVPFGLELSQRLSWHAPFVFTALLALLVMGLASRKLPYRPAFNATHSLRDRVRLLGLMLTNRLALMAYAFMALTMLAGFMIIPNIATHLQYNLDFPRESLGMLYLVGGALSFFGMRFSGWLTDRRSATLSVCVFTITLCMAIAAGFVWYPNKVPITMVFAVFMISATGRMVAAQSLSSLIPQPSERGAYMSVQSSITHIASALGAYYSTMMLVEDHGKLMGVPTVGLTAIGLSLLIPVLVYAVERAKGLRVP